jgi:hypothetical protein
VDAEVALVEMKEKITLEMDKVQEAILHQSVARQDADEASRAAVPAPILEVWRILSDERDILQEAQRENRERCLPLEHSDLNDIESSVAQQTIRQELKELLHAIHVETVLIPLKNPLSPLPIMLSSLWNKRVMDWLVAANYPILPSGL